MNINKKHIPLISGNQIAPYFDYIKNFEPQLQHVIRDADIPFNLFNDPQSYISRTVALRFFRLLVVNLPIARLLNLIRYASKRNAYEVIKNMHIRGSVLDSLSSICKGMKQDVSDSSFNVICSSGSWYFVRNRKENEDKYLEVLTIVFMISIVQYLLGANWYPEKIYSRQNKESKIGSLLSFPTSDVSYSNNSTAILLPSHIEDTRIDLDMTPINQVDKCINSFESSLKILLTPYFYGKTPTIFDAANYANMSVRTLQRRLKEEGTSFLCVISDLKVELACDSLIHTSLPVSQISDMLGYSSSTHMTRAFKKKMGSTPSNYRKSH